MKFLLENQETKHFTVFIYDNGNPKKVYKDMETDSIEEAIRYLEGRREALGDDGYIYDNELEDVIEQQEIDSWLEFAAEVDSYGSEYDDEDLDESLNENTEESRNVDFWDWANKVNQDVLGYLTPVDPEIDDYIQSGAVEDFIYSEDEENLRKIVDKFSYYLKDGDTYIRDIANGKMYYDDKISVFMNKEDAEHYAKEYNLKIGKANVNFSDLLIEKLIQSDSEEAFKKNVETEIEAGKDPKQAVAIAHAVKEKNEDLEESYIYFDDLKFGDIVRIKNWLKPENKYRYIGRNKIDNKHLFRDLQDNKIVSLANDAILIKDQSNQFTGKENITAEVDKNLEEDLDSMPSIDHTLYVLHNVLNWDRSYSPEDLSDVRSVARACHLYDNDYSTQEFIEAIEYYDLFDEEGNVTSEIEESLQEDTHLVDSYYMVDVDNDIKGDHLTREEARELAKEFKDSFEDYIYITRNATYDTDNGRDVDYEDIVNIDKREGELVTHVDKFNIFNECLTEDIIRTVAYHGTKDSNIAKDILENGFKGDSIFLSEDEYDAQGYGWYTIKVEDIDSLNLYVLDGDELDKINAVAEDVKNTRNYDGIKYRYSDEHPYNYEIFDIVNLNKLPRSLGQDLDDTMYEATGEEYIASSDANYEADRETTREVRKELAKQGIATNTEGEPLNEDESIDNELIDQLVKDGYFQEGEIISIKYIDDLDPYIIIKTKDGEKAYEYIGGKLFDRIENNIHECSCGDLEECNEPIINEEVDEDLTEVIYNVWYTDDIDGFEGVLPYQYSYEDAILAAKLNLDPEKEIEIEEETRYYKDLADKEISDFTRREFKKLYTGLVKNLVEED